MIHDRRQEDNDAIPDALYDDWDGTAIHVPEIKDFYRKIKENCPETVFHGTDVGHQYATTGERFLQYLWENGRDKTEQYRLVQDAIKQGKRYYKRSDNVYCENAMTANFIQEYDKLGGADIMGIYGYAHTDIVTIQVGDKEYDASYFGQADLSSFLPDYQYREFWRLEDAYADFKDNPVTGDVLPYNNYPMAVEEAQVFVIDYTKTDGSVIRKYYRSDGNTWQGNPATEEFSSVLKHILDKDSVASGGILHQHMGDCPHKLPVLNDGGAAHTLDNPAGELQEHRVCDLQLYPAVDIIMV